MSFGSLPKLSGVDAPTAIVETFSSSAHYLKDSFNFLKELVPDIDLNLFDNLKSISSPMLNILFDLGLQVYGAFRFGEGNTLSILLSIYNFYLTLKETSSWKRLIIGFLDLMNSIFSLDKIPDLFRLVQKTVLSYFSSLKKYFLVPESAEKTVKNFWDMVSLSDDRSFFNIVWELGSVFSTIAYLRELKNSFSLPDTIEDGLDIIRTHLLDPTNELRIRVKNASTCIARIADFFALNLIHLIKGNFKEITWSLPLPMQFENEFAAFSAEYKHYLENPLYLEEINKTVVQLRDEAAALIKKAHAEILRSHQGAVKSAMTRYLKDLNSYHTQLVEALNPNNMKPQPMSVVLIGPAGCGKSSLSTNIGKIMQVIAGRSIDENLIKNKGGDPKFEPAITSSTEVIVIDDFANDTDRKIPSKEILDSVNVTREVIPKASVEEKNRHKYSNIGTVITTNDPNIGINQIATINYDSILRRYGLIIQVAIKEEYRKEDSEILDQHHPDLQDGKQHPEIYELTLKRPLRAISVPNSREKHVEYEIIEGWQHPDVCDCIAAFKFMKTELAKIWERNVKQHENRHNPDRICVDCCLDRLACTCQLDKMQEPESFSNIPSKLVQGFDRFHQGFDYLQDNTINLFVAFDEMAILGLSNLSLSWAMFRSSVTNYTSIYKLFSFLWSNMYSIGISFLLWICLCLLTPYGSYIPLVFFGLLTYFRRDIPLSVTKMIVSLGLGYGVYAWYNSTLNLLCTPFILAVVLTIRRYYTTQREIIDQHYLRCDLIRSHFFSRMTIYGFVGGVGVLTILQLVIKTMNFFPKSHEAKRDPSQEPYLPTFKQTNSDSIGKYFFSPKPAEAAQTASRDEAMKFIGKKIVLVRISQNNDEECTEVRGIPLGSEILLPAHALPNKGLFDVEICADYAKRTSSYRSVDVPQTAYTQLIDRSGKPVDMVLLNVPNVPTQPDLSRFFAQDQVPVMGAAQELLKHHDGSYHLIDVRVRQPPFFDRPRYNTNRGLFENFASYRVEAEDHTSSQGDCGSPVISEDANCIIGIHICGTGTNTWYALKITSDMIANARKYLKSESGRFISHPVPEKFVVKANHQKLIFDDVVKRRAVDSIGAFISPIEEVGTILKDGELYSDRAEKHYFKNKNPRLEEAFGPRVVQPPKYPNGEKQINSTLEKLNAPKFDVPIDLIDKAADDYLNTGFGSLNFDALICELRESRNDFFSVRSLDEAKKGDGSGIVGGINNNSSAGALYGGKKPRHYDMDIDGDPLEERKLLPYMVADIERQEIEWRSGRGTYDPFKRCSKTNELLPWTKAEEKTRSFYSNDMVFFLNMTRAIIPLKHVLRKSMPLSECFVGIAAQSKQWEMLKTFLDKNGEYNNFVCGDFSGYDTQLPKALLDKAAWILVEMARRGGMCESDLEFLRGALSSVVSPTLWWQGHVLRMANGQPSGQPLTVEINSIVNSLLMRMVFFTIMKEEHPEIKDPVFRDFVRLATYGDDNALGVDPSIPGYNHTNIQAVFARWGIKYTMADKEADSVPYQTIQEISFLKRSFRYHDDLGMVAPIEVTSITKCFYYWVRSKNTPLTFQRQFDEFVKSQSREAFLHGKEFYSKFCDGVKLLQEGSVEDKEEFHIKWNGYHLLSYLEMLEELEDSYES